MPSVDDVLDTATHSSWFGDAYTAEIFHNYKLSEKDQPYAGVDVSWTKKGKALRREQWTRMAMGILSHLFSTKMMFVWGMEFIIGDS